MLLLLALRCPERGRPLRSWYIPGAVVRLGIAGIRRAWRGFFGEPAPGERTLNRHVAVLERGAALVRAPGAWIPTGRGARPARWPDTFHVLEDDRDSEWWAREGLELLEEHPEARTNPGSWGRTFRSWKRRAREPQGRLPFPPTRPAPTVDAESVVEGPEAARRVLRGLASSEPLDLLAALRDVGAAPTGRVLTQVAARLEPLRAAAARLARELGRGTRIRNRAGWLVWAFRAAGGWIEPAAGWRSERRALA